MNAVTIIIIIIIIIIIVVVVVVVSLKRAAPKEPIPTCRRRNTASIPWYSQRLSGERERKSCSKMENRPPPQGKSIRELDRAGAFFLSLFQNDGNAHTHTHTTVRMRLRNDGHRPTPTTLGSVGDFFFFFFFFLFGMREWPLVWVKSLPSQVNEQGHGWRPKPKAEKSFTWQLVAHPFSGSQREKARSFTTNKNKRTRPAQGSAAITRGQRLLTSACLARL